MNVNSQLHNWFRKFRAVHLLFMLSAASLCNLQAAEISARLGTNHIPEGGHTFLTLQIEGTSRCDVELPKVDGLVLRNNGKSQNTSIVNGKISKSVIFRIVVLGEKEGTFTIPPIKVIADKETHQTESFSVTVSNNPSASTGSHQPTNNSQQLTAEDIHRFAHIIIESPSKKVFVGQRVPVVIELWVNEHHQFEGLSAPNFENDSIMMDALGLVAGEDYSQSIQYKGQDRYEVFRWEAHFTPVEAGDTTLQFQREITLMVQSRRRSSSFGSIFDSDFFGRNYQRYPLLIKSNKIPISIHSLPDNKPESFSGAIGSYQLDVTAAPKILPAGDPITLKIEVSGSGSFDRINLTGLENVDGFKTYTPEVHFEPANQSSGTKAVKSFKQAIIPTATIEAIPSIQFSYFDPKQETYVELASDPIPVEITGDAIIAHENYDSESKHSGTGLETLASDGWIAPLLEIGTPVESFRPIIQTPLAWVISLGLPSALFLAGVFAPVLFRSKNQEEIKRNELRKQLNLRKAQIAKSIKDQSASDFINHASTYSRLLLGFRWEVSAESITTADAKNRLGDQYPQTLKLLQTYDALQYASGQANELDLKATHEAIIPEWKKLKSESNIDE